MIIPHSIWMTIAMLAILVLWGLFGAHFWRAFYTAHNMRVHDPIFCQWIKSSLRIGFVFGVLSAALVPLFIYLLEFAV